MQLKMIVYFVAKQKELNSSFVLVGSILILRNVIEFEEKKVLYANCRLCPSRYVCSNRSN